MADSRHITRRAALVGAIASTATLPIPVVAATDPDAVIQHHAWQLACALARKHGGLWEYDLFNGQAADGLAVLFKRERDAPTGAMQLFK